MVSTLDHDGGHCYDVGGIRGDVGRQSRTLETKLTTNEIECNSTHSQVY